MKNVQFRQWVFAKWYEHQREVRDWSGIWPSLTFEQYVRENRWFLRKLYQQEK